MVFCAVVIIGTVACRARLSPCCSGCRLSFLAIVCRSRLPPVVPGYRLSFRTAARRFAWLVVRLAIDPLITHHSSLITGHWSLVTHHWSLITGPCCCPPSATLNDCPQPHVLLAWGLLS